MSDGEYEMTASWEAPDSARALNKPNDPEVHGAKPSPVSGGYKGLWKKIKAWCKNHKILTALGALLFLIGTVAIILIIIVFGIAPAIVHHIVKTAQIEVVDMALLNPVSDSVNVTFLGLLTKTSPLPAILLSSTYTLSINGSTIGTLSMPDTKLGPGAPHSLRSGTSLLSFGSVLDVSNHTLFVNFARTLVRSTSVVLSMSGSTAVKIPSLFGIKIHVVVTKDLTIIGLNGLQGITLQDSTFGQTPANETCTSISLDTYVAFNNPSQVSMLPLGDLALDVFYMGYYMGYALAKNVSMAVGPNAFPAKVFLAPANLTAASILVADFLAARPIDAVVQGTNNSSSIALYASALQDLVVDMSFQNPSPTVLIPSLVVSDLGLVPIDNYTALMSVNLVSEINNPLGNNCPLTVFTVAIDTALNASDGIAGSLVSPADQTTILDQTDTSLSMYSSAFFNVEATNYYQGTTSYFATMLAAIENSNQTTIYFQGSLNITAHITALGNVSLNSIPMDLAVNISGLQSLPGGLIASLGIPGNYPSGTATNGLGLALNAVASLRNPANISMFLGDVDFDMYYDGYLMGKVTSVNTSVHPGVNDLSTFGYLLPSNLTAAAGFFHNYLFGANSSVTIQGLPNPYSLSKKKNTLSPRFDITWLNQALEALNLQAIVPCISVNLVPSVVISSLSIDFTQSSGIPIADGSMIATYAFPSNLNFPVNFTYLALNAALGYQGSTISSLVIPSQVVVNNQGAHQFTIALSSIPMVVATSSTVSFETFVGDLVTSSALTATLSGTATSVGVQTNLGTLPMTNIPLTNNLAFNGLNYLYNCIVVPVGGVNVTAGYTDHLDLRLTLFITNPSTLSMKIGNFALDMWFNGFWVGNATMNNVNLLVGTHSYTAFAKYYNTSNNAYINANPSAPSIETPANRDLLSMLVSKVDVPVTLVGSTNSVAHPLLKPGIAKLVTNTTVPALQLIVGIILTNANIGTGKVDANIVFNNSFGVPIAVSNPQISVFDNNHNQMATLTGSFVLPNGTTLNPTIPANSVWTSQAYVANLLVTWADFGTLAGALFSGGVTMAMSGAVTATIDNTHVQQIYIDMPNVAGVCTQDMCGCNILCFCACAPL